MDTFKKEFHRLYLSDENDGIIEVISVCKGIQATQISAVAFEFSLHVLEDREQT